MFRDQPAARRVFHRHVPDALKVHRTFGAKMREFQRGWDMPVEYPSSGGLIAEHRAVRGSVAFLTSATWATFEFAAAASRSSAGGGAAHQHE